MTKEKALFIIQKSLKTAEEKGKTVIVVSDWGSITEGVQDYSLNEKEFTYTDVKTNVRKWVFNRKDMSEDKYDILGRPVSFRHMSAYYFIFY